jgi:tetratricopeptide (TPR) repeat protein
MKTSLRIAALLAVALGMLSGTGCTKLRARDQLNKGVQAYKNAKYEEAITHFQQAVDLDPALLNGRLYLATAFANQYIPGADNDDNNRLAQQAIEQFTKVLDMNPGRDQKTTSLKGIASLYFNMGKLDQAKEYHKKVTEVDPNDPEAYYSIGVIDWTQSYKPRGEARAKINGLKPDEAFPTKSKSDKETCMALKDKYTPNVQEGIDALNKALELRPDYDDAMAYMNLLYREKADYSCGDSAARAADIKTADEWVDKTMATKKAKAEKQPGAQGITMDQSGGK